MHPWLAPDHADKTSNIVRFDLNYGEKEVNGGPGTRFAVYHRRGGAQTYTR